MPVCVPRNNAMPVSTNMYVKTMTKCMKLHRIYIPFGIYQCHCHHEFACHWELREVRSTCTCTT